MMMRTRTYSLGGQNGFAPDIAGSPAPSKRTAKTPMTGSQNTKAVQALFSKPSRSRCNQGSCSPIANHNSTLYD